MPWWKVLRQSYGAPTDNVALTRGFCILPYILLYILHIKGYAMHTFTAVHNFLDACSGTQISSPSGEHDVHSRKRRKEPCHNRNPFKVVPSVAGGGKGLIGPRQERLKNPEF